MWERLIPSPLLPRKREGMVPSSCTNTPTVTHTYCAQPASTRFDC